jgi:hypothetical protein
MVQATVRIWFPNNQRIWFQLSVPLAQKVRKQIKKPKKKTKKKHSSQSWTALNPVNSSLVLTMISALLTTLKTLTFIHPVMQRCPRKLRNIISMIRKQMNGKKTMNTMISYYLPSSGVF